MSNEQLTQEQVELIQQQVIDLLNEIDPTKGRLIQMKQGARSQLKNDSLELGEPCYLTDDQVFVIGTGNGYVEFLNKNSFDGLELADGSITIEKLNQEIRDKLNSITEGATVNVVDNLDSDSAQDALSANQGKALKQLIETNKVNLASSTENGLLSSALFDKINGIEEGANKTTIVDNLTSISTTSALSANQGKVLNDKIQSMIETGNATVIVDRLDSTATNEALSANQGKVLNDKIQNIIDNPVGVTLVNNLTSASGTEALAANQGRVLDENQKFHANKRASLTELGHVNHGVVTINLTETWTGLQPPHTQNVDVEGILANDTPFITPVYSSETATAVLQNKDYNKIDNVECIDGRIFFTCFTEKPENPLTLQVKIVR